MNSKNDSDLIKNDALQAYKTFLTARSFFFWLMIIAWLCSQAAFWTVDRGVIDPILNTTTPENKKTTQPEPENKKTSFVITQALADFDTPLQCIEEPAVQDQPSTPNNDEKQNQKNSNKLELAQKCNQIFPVTLKVCYYVLTFFSILYPLTLLVTLNIAIVGRLGGFADAAKALFLALATMVLIVPWPKHIATNVATTLFTYNDLLQQYLVISQNPNLFQYAFYYWQFVGMGFITFFLLIAAQWYSSRSAKIACQTTTPRTVPGPLPNDNNDTIPLS